MKALRSTLLISSLVSICGCAVETGSDDQPADADEAAAAVAEGDEVPGQAPEAAELDEVVARRCDDHNRLANNVPVADATGVFTTVSTHGSIDLNNEFFQDLGTNGRRCVSCHVPTVGWTITPSQLQKVFDY